MGFIAEAKRKNLWFGTEEKMEWFKTPSRGADTSPAGWDSEGTTLNGGGYVFNSFGSHKQYQFDWGSSNARVVAQKMKSYADGSYGRGYIYFVDPTIYDHNVLPAHWADPSMGIDYEGNSIVAGVDPVGVPTGANSNDLPVQAAQFNLNTIPVGFRGKAQAVYVPIPEGHTLSLGAMYSFTGSGGVFASPVLLTGAIAAPQKLTTLGVNTPNIVADTFSGVRGVWLWVGKTSAGNSSVTIHGLIGRLMTDAEATSYVIAENLFTNPRLVGDGTWAEAGRNYVNNPRLVSDGSRVEVRRNLVSNPMFRGTAGTVTRGFSLSAATFNIASVVFDSGHPWAWADRKSAAAEWILSSGAAIVAAQEFDAAGLMTNDLSLLLPGWTVFQGVTGNIRNAILWDTSRVRLIGDIETDPLEGIENRTVVSGVFRGVGSNVSFLFASTHLTSVSNELRAAQAEEVADILITQRGASGMPVVVGADWASNYSTGDLSPLKIMEDAGFRPTSNSTTVENPTFNTFSAWDPTLAGRQNGSWIDQLYTLGVSNHVSGGPFVVSEGGGVLPMKSPLPSDHLPVRLSVSGAVSQAVAQSGAAAIAVGGRAGGVAWRDESHLALSGTTVAGSGCYPAGGGTSAGDAMARLGLEKGKSYAAAVVYRQDEAPTSGWVTTGGDAAVVRTMNVGRRDAGTTTWNVLKSATAPNQAGVDTLLTVTFTIPTDANLEDWFISFVYGCNQGVSYWSEFRVMEGPTEATALQRALDYFDGDTVLSDPDLACEWVGAVNASPSIITGERVYSSSYSGCIPVRSTFPDGTPAVRLISTTGAGWYSISASPPGEVSTGTIHIYRDKPVAPSSAVNIRTLASASESATLATAATFPPVGEVRGYRAVNSIGPGAIINLRPASEVDASIWYALPGIFAGDYRYPWDGSPDDLSGITQPEDFRTRWTGTVNNSELVLEIERVRGLTGNNCIAGVSSKSGIPAVRLVPSSPSTDSYAEVVPAPMLSGGTYTAIGKLTLDSPLTGALGGRSRRIARALPVILSEAAPNAEGETELRLTDESAGTRLLYYHGGSQGSGDVWWTEIGLFAGNYDGTAFSGSSPQNGATHYRWAGAPDNSTSQAYIPSSKAVQQLRGPWVGGMGHSGCRFVGKPTFIENGPNWTGFSATFKEVVN